MGATNEMVLSTGSLTNSPMNAGGNAPMFPQLKKPILVKKPLPEIAGLDDHQIEKIHSELKSKVEREEEMQTLHLEKFIEKQRKVLSRRK